MEGTIVEVLDDTTVRVRFETAEGQKVEVMKVKNQETNDLKPKQGERVLFNRGNLDHFQRIFCKLL
jgi:hypothetical protein